MPDQATLLRNLTKRIPPQYIGENGRGMDAMDHTVVEQYLLMYHGFYQFLHEESLYSVPKKGGDPVLNGAIAKLGLKIDGEWVWVREAGGVENPHIQDGDGERLKIAMSDAFKRCAMRFGVGLHLWAQEHYFLDKVLARAAEKQQGGDPDRLKNARQEIGTQAPDPGNGSAT